MKNTDLIKHFGSFLSTDPERKAAVKGTFKSFVDSVAVVQVENREKYVCLRKRFRGSVRREDGRDGPRSASGLSAADPHDNRHNDCIAVKPGECQSHALSSTVPSQNKDAEQEIPPASVCAGAGARTPPKTSLDGSALRAFTSAVNTTGNKTEMGNHNGSVGISDKTLHGEQTTGECIPEISETEPSHLPATDGSKFIHPPCLPTRTEARSEDRVDQSNSDISESESAPTACVELTEKAGSGSTRVGLGSADEGRNTPKGSRKSFIAHLMNSSPQIRRSLVLRQSRHAAKNDGDLSCVNSAHIEEESSAVTLDPVEHEWMMCACDGEWESLRRLLNSEPNLVSRKDFVTGFTCIHWAAKMGKHELLAEIVNFARQRNVALDINARSSAGYTPLHLAAMHNHTEVIKLLVGACDANVETRDYNGKKASQYLRSDVARDVLDIAGATCELESEELALGNDAARWKLPRVLQANLRLLNRSASEDDDCVGGLTRDRPLRRKSSFSKLKPRLSKMRAGITPIVHSTSHFERLEGATGQASGSFRSRPKSNLFG